MLLNPYVRSVRSLPGHHLEVVFTNGERKVFDIEPFLDRGIFSQLKDEKLFSEVRVVAGSVEWPCGCDFSYDTLYVLGKPANTWRSDDNVHRDRSVAEQPSSYETAQPQLFILAGPNGAGKTTFSARLIPEGVPFINADEIARTLKGFEGTAQDMRASRILLETVSEYEKHHQSFAIETNLANRALLRRIERLQAAGYTVTLIFVWLSSVDLAIDRVMERVRRGGHSVPAEVIRRRFRLGLSNFLTYYQPQANSWFFIDNSMGDTRLVASQERPDGERIFQHGIWDLIRKGAAPHE